MQGDALANDWLTQADFANAVAYGQITPGPVTHTVALIGWAAAGPAGALLASAIAFAPSFAFVLLGGDSFEALRSRPGAARVPRRRRARRDRRDPRRGGAARRRARRRVAVGGARGRRARPRAAAARRCSCCSAAGRPGWRSAPDALRSPDGRRLQQETADVLAQADPVQHGQPARERAGLPGVAARLPDRGRARVRARRRRARAAEPRRHARAAPSPARCSATSPTSTPCSPTPEDWTHDPWSGEIARRPPVGPRRDRHEDPDGGRGRRGGAPGARRLAARARRAEGLRGRRRGDRRRARAPSGSCENHPDLARVDYLLNEGAGAVMPVRRPAPVRRLLRGEGHLPLRRRARAGAPATRRCPAIADNALLKLAPALERLGSRRPAYDVTDEPRAFLRAIGEDPDDPEGAVARIARRRPAAGRDGRADAGRHLRADDHQRRREDQRHPGPRRAPGRLPRPARDGRRGDDGAHPRGARRRSTASRSTFIEQVVGNRSPIETPLMDAIRDWVGERGPGRRGRAGGAARVHRLAPLARRLPRLRRLRLLPPAPPDLYETWPLIHADDERIDVRDLGVAAELLPRAAEEAAD